MPARLGWPAGRAVMDLKALGARLRSLREAAGLSQEALAARAGVSQRAVSSWELALREPGWLAVLALARALGVQTTAFERGPARAGRPPAAKKGKGKAK